MDEALHNQEERERLDEQDLLDKEDRRQERDDSTYQKRREAKQLVEELQQFVLQDGGQWRLRKAGAGQGAKITRAHLDAVFLAFGKTRNNARMEDMLSPVQDLLQWDALSGAFVGTLGWDAERKHWVVFTQ